MKVLVLENVRKLDEEISSYLNKFHSDDSIKTLYNLNDIEQAELFAELSNCDIICLQSIFYDREQLKMFLALLPKFKNIKEINIIFGLNKPEDNNQLLKLLNNDSKEIKELTIELLKSIKVNEILFKTVISKKRTYFDEHEVLFDKVPLFYNEEFKYIWHEFYPIINRTGVQFELYKKETVVKEKTKTAVKVKENSALINVLSIDKSDLKTFKDISKELRALIEHQKELCEDSKNTELIEEKNEWLNFLDKYNL
jgi:hypothetical protein